MKHYTAAALLLIICQFKQIYSQPAFIKGYFQAPLDIEMYLSGNFGEFRTDHFHTGIDIKTQGVTGKKVYAVAEGYISRIKIESGGYGRTIYINHPAGYMTVYAHLDRFTKEIEKYVKNVQYEKHLHALNIYPDKQQFPVKKGQLVAYSGNSGYSFGPHLHFEVRNAANQDPMNVLLFDFNITDNLSPEIFSVSFYPQDARSFVNQSNNMILIKTIKNNGSYVLQTDSPVIVSGNIGFGIEAFDYLDGTRNKCGLYSVELKVDSNLIYSWQMDHFSFGEARYINSLIDYEEKNRNQRYIHKAFIEPDNKLSLYEHQENNGIVSFTDNDLHAVTFILKDARQNATQLSFMVRSQEISKVSDPVNNVDYLQLMPWNTTNVFERDEIRLILPEGTLYKDLKFKYARGNQDPAFFSPFHVIHNRYTPLHMPCDLYILAHDLPDSLSDKALIVIIDDEGKSSSAGGEWVDRFVKTKILDFGTYAVAIDTAAPQILPLDIPEGLNMTSRADIKFKVKDDLSGIKSYEGYIDNEWALFEYDAKNDLVFYTFDPERISRNTKHELELYIVDNKDNIGSFFTGFFW